MGGGKDAGKLGLGCRPVPESEYWGCGKLPESAVCAERTTELYAWVCRKSEVWVWEEYRKGRLGVWEECRKAILGCEKSTGKRG